MRERNDSNESAAVAPQKISRAAGGEGEDGGSVQLAVMVNDTGIFPNLTIV